MSKAYHGPGGILSPKSLPLCMGRYRFAALVLVASDVSARNSCRDSARYFTSAGDGSPRFTSAFAQAVAHLCRFNLKQKLLANAQGRFPDSV
jgi:hypothetical protein